MSDLDTLRNAIIDGDSKAAKAAVEALIAAAADPQAMVTGTLIPAMDEVGRRFECGDYFVPEMLISARAMKECLKILKPLLANAGSRSSGRVIIGTVKGDLHDIGKNLVAAMLEGAGFEVIDLGVDVPPDRFVAEVKSSGANLIALSALLTTTMPAMKVAIEALESAGVRSQVKIMIGGAPITQGYADEIGADGYSDSASSAVVLARRLVASAV